MTEGEDDAKRVWRGMERVLGSQLAGQVLTIGLSLWTVRKIGSFEYGISNVSVDLLRQLALFLSTEGLRRAAMRRTDKSVSDENDDDNEDNGNEKGNDSAERARKSVSRDYLSSEKSRVTGSREESVDVAPAVSSLNLSVLSVWFGVLTAVMLGALWLLVPPKEVALRGMTMQYVCAVAATSIAASLELMAEPFIIGCVGLGRHTARPVARSTANVGQAIAKAVGVAVAPRKAMVALSCASIVYSLIYLLCLVREYNNALADGDVSNATLECEGTRVSFRRYWKLYKLDGAVISRGKASNLAERSNTAMSFMPISQLSDLAATVRTYVSADHQQLGFLYVQLAAQKSLLSYGEQMLTVALFTGGDWGAVGLVTAVGGLVCRMAFAPLEEYATASFSNSGRDDDDDDDDDDEDVIDDWKGRVDGVKVSDHQHQMIEADEAAAAQGGQPRRRTLQEKTLETGHRNDGMSSSTGAKTAKQTEPIGRRPKGAARSEALATFRVILTAESTFGIWSASFLPCTAFATLMVAYGAHWAENAADLLAKYSYILYLMAINGILEAFVHSSASPRWLARCRKFNVVACLAFGASAVLLRFLFPSLGSASLFYSSGFSIVLRICWAVKFILQFENAQHWHDLVPKELVVAQLLVCACGIATRVTQTFFIAPHRINRSVVAESETAGRLVVWLRQWLSGSEAVAAAEILTTCPFCIVGVGVGAWAMWQQRRRLRQSARTE